jgi:hypothetical protein
MDIPGAQTAANVLSPIYSSQVTDDPVARELARLRLGLGKSRPVVFGRTPAQMQMGDVPEEEYGVELDPEQYDRLLVLAGQGGQAPVNKGVPLEEFAELPTFREALASLMGHEEYRNDETGDGGRRLLIRKMDEKFKKAARAQLLREYPGLVTMIESKQRERANSIRREPQEPAEGVNRAIQSLGR